MNDTKELRDTLEQIQAELRDTRSLLNQYRERDAARASMGVVTKEEFVALVVAVERAAGGSQSVRDVLSRARLLAKGVDHLFGDGEN